jgi:predicted transcriptional regulator
MQLTERDRDIVRAVYAFRLLRQDQAQRLFFTSRSTAQRALQRLYQHGYLDRRFLPVTTGRSPTLYTLDRRGVELLRLEDGLDNVSRYAANELKSDFLMHLAAINDVRIAVTLDAKRAGYALTRWLSDHELKADYDRVQIVGPSGRRQSVSLIPDSYFTLKTPRGYANCFLEVDMGTMALERFKNKVRAYIAYYRSGAFEQRYGARAVRILTVTSSARRLENLKAATEAADGQYAFWFALADDLTPDAILGQPVWQVAQETTRKSLIEPVSP